MTKFQCYLSIVLIFCFGLFTLPATSNQELGTKPEKNNDLTLRFVSAVFRHGDRMMTNSETYPNDPYKDYDSYPVARGHLTKTGMARAYQLGQELRKRYDSFLGDIYYPPNVYARSTFVDRCKMTLQLVLAGLYPPTNNQQKWNSQLFWQPMSMKYANSPELDCLLTPTGSPAYRNTLGNIMQSSAIKAETEKYKDLMKTISTYTGSEISNLLSLALTRQSLDLQSSLNLTLPEWAQEMFSDEQFSKVVTLAFDIFSYNDQLIRINGGILLRRMIDDFNKMINGTLTKRKINLFSAHDFNVHGLLRALGKTNMPRPEFTSSVILELYEKVGKYFVKVLYYLGIPSKTLEITIPGCELLCPYEKFLELTSATTATDEDLSCPLNLIEDSRSDLF